MSDNSCFDHLGTEINDKELYLSFLEGINSYVTAIEEEHTDSVVDSFQARARAHEISSNQEKNAILYDIALSLRVLSGRNK